MCLILFAIDQADHRLVVAANRDEYYARPASRADFWSDHPSVLAGRDLQAGGTWLGVTTGGRFAAVTNFRETPPQPMPPRSRGDLTADFLTGSEAPSEYLARIAQRGHLYRGFNLLIADPSGAYYYSNRGGLPKKLPAGVYGLSNQLLDCDWPKVVGGREKLDALLKRASPIEAQELCFDLLADRGDGRANSPSFIESPEYGTCAATFVRMTSREVQLGERGFKAGGVGTGDMRHQFNMAVS
jgi:uncharacterized protein with NRDE domain